MIEAGVAGIPKFWGHPFRVLKSVAILGHNDQLDNWIDLVQLTNWIPVYDEFFKKAVGVYNGENLHVLYHRDVSLISDELRFPPDDLEAFCDVVKGCGYSASLTTLFEEWEREGGSLKSFVKSQCFNVIGFKIRELEECDFDYFKMVRDAVETTLAEQISLGLIGDIRSYQRAGLLSEEFVNRADLTFYPSTCLTVVEQPSPDHPVVQCFERLRLFINSDGRFYSCYGLVGIPHAALGHLEEPLNETLLGNSRALKKLGNLAYYGPGLEGPHDGTRRSGLPFICEKHREEVLLIKRFWT